MDFSYPLSSDPAGLVLIFVVALGISHALLLPIFGFNELCWHSLDYVWLPMVLLGVLGGAHQNRIEISTAYRSAWEHQLRRSLMEANRLLDYHTSDRTYLCRTGVRSEYSPPSHVFDQIEKDDTEACKWFMNLRGVVPKSLEAIPEGVILAELPPPPTLSGHSGSGPEDAINNMTASMREIIDAREQIKIHDKERLSPLSVQVAKYYGPILVCIALAIRITKVTGEARIKRRKLVSTV